MKNLLLAALMAGVASSALAADLPTHKSPPPPPSVYAPQFNWTGFYIGVNGGFGFGETNPSGFGNMHVGGLVGGTAGYNYQINQFVVGYEGDLDWSSMSTGSTPTLLGSAKLKTDAITTQRVRLGYAMDRTLLFLTGGYAGIQTHGTFNDVVNGFSGSQSRWQSGGVIGAGVEYAITNNISLKGEYLYAPTFSRTYFAGTPDSQKAGLGLSLFRAGLNYKF